MNDWRLFTHKKVKLSKPILIEGLPGAGNVGKIAVDFVIDDLKATKLYTITSCSFANCAFVSEKGVASVPVWEIFHKKVKGVDYLFLSGDVQPSDSAASYSVSHELLALFSSLGGSLIVTLGGYALDDVPVDPQLFAVATDVKTLKSLPSSLVTYGSVATGPIIGVSGLLVGLALHYNVKGVCVLAETFADPTYLGLGGARKILSLLKQQFNFRLRLKQLDSDVAQVEKEISEKISQLTEYQAEKGRELFEELAPYIG